MISLLTFTLRKDIWSNGEPFTAEILFWYEDLMMNPKLEKKTISISSSWKPMTVDVIDDVTARFNLPSPFPGLTATIAWSYNQFYAALFLNNFILK